MISQAEVTDRITKLLLSTNRPGIQALLAYLNSSDFFTAPACSGDQHNPAEQEPGGLALHSLRVYEVFKAKLDNFLVDVPPETVVIAPLLHDLCKADFYVKGTKWAKDAQNKWIQVPVWKVEDKLPVGHGEKSVIVAMRYIPLSDLEVAMIRWHMGAYEGGINFGYPTGYAFYGAMDKFPPVRLLANADNEAAYLHLKGSDLW